LQTLLQSIREIAAIIPAIMALARLIRRGTPMHQHALGEWRAL